MKKEVTKSPVIAAVKRTPSVDKTKAGFMTGLAVFQLVPNPP